MAQNSYTERLGRIPPIGWLTIVGGTMAFLLLVVVAVALKHSSVEPAVFPTTSQLGEAYRPDAAALLGRELRSKPELLSLHKEVWNDADVMHAIRGQLRELNPTLGNAISADETWWAEYDRLSVRIASSEAVLRQSCRSYENRARSLGISHEVYYLGPCQGFSNN